MNKYIIILVLAGTVGSATAAAEYYLWKCGAKQFYARSPKKEVLITKGRLTFGLRQAPGWRITKGKNPRRRAVVDNCITPGVRA